MKFFLILFFVSWFSLAKITESNITGTWAFTGVPWCIDNPSGEGFDLDTASQTEALSSKTISEGSIVRVRRDGSSEITLVTPSGYINEMGNWNIEDDGFALKVEGSSGKLYLTYIGELPQSGMVLAFEGAETQEEEESLCGEDRGYIFPYTKISEE